MKKDMAAFLRRVGSASVKRMKQNIDIIHQETGVSKAFLAMDMLHCTVTYNIGYLDYRVFGFAENRDPKNRRTYMTMHHNSVLSNKLNDRQAISVFIDKPRFNRRFASFLHRDYILLDEKGAADFAAFCKGRTSVFAKVTDSFGGQGLELIALDEDTDYRALYERLKAEKKLLVILLLMLLAFITVTTRRVLTLEGQSFSICGCWRMVSSTSSFFSAFSRSYSAR